MTFLTVFRIVVSVVFALEGLEGKYLEWHFVYYEQCYRRTIIVIFRRFRDSIWIEPFRQCVRVVNRLKDFPTSGHYWHCRAHGSEVMFITTNAMTRDHLGPEHQSPW